MKKYKNEKDTRLFGDKRRVIGGETGDERGRVGAREDRGKEGGRVGKSVIR